jgi:hypothetical protein
MTDFDELLTEKCYASNYGKSVQSWED